MGTESQRIVRQQRVFYFKLKKLKILNLRRDKGLFYGHFAVHLDLLLWDLYETQFVKNLNENFLVLISKKGGC